jgi:hypothetical protein
MSNDDTPAPRVWRPPTPEAPPVPETFTVRDEGKPVERDALRTTIQRHAPSLVSRLLRLAESEDDATALRATSLLLDLGYGRAPVAPATERPATITFRTALPPTPLSRPDLFGPDGKLLPEHEAEHGEAIRAYDAQRAAAEASRAAPPTDPRDWRDPGVPKVAMRGRAVKPPQ